MRKNKLSVILSKRLNQWQAVKVTWNHLEHTRFFSKEITNAEIVFQLPMCSLGRYGNDSAIGKEAIKAGGSVPSHQNANIDIIKIGPTKHDIRYWWVRQHLTEVCVAIENGADIIKLFLRKPASITSINQSSLG